MTDIIADMLTRIRNGQMRRLISVKVPYSRFREQVLKVLMDEGYVKSYKKQNVRKNIDEMVVQLKYLKNGTPVINEVKKVSKPGRRLYTAVSDLSGFYNDLGVTILSTSKGILSDKVARKENVGGEIICQIF
ncbi:MAG: 30S ribosomal protein S8 [Alphaproteobacteria bacterium]|nr:30S ribosomal protein S8 [Alphaproteobacteria bacterium]